MVRTIDLINHTKAFADAGIGVDADKKYGTQCVDEVNDLSITFFGRTLWGNAIDLLNSARDLGYEVEYNQERVRYLCKRPLTYSVIHTATLA